MSAQSKKIIALCPLGNCSDLALKYDTKSKKSGHKPCCQPFITQGESTKFED